MYLLSYERRKVALCFQTNLLYMTSYIVMLLIIHLQDFFFRVELSRLQNSDEKCENIYDAQIN